MLSGVRLILACGLSCLFVTGTFGCGQRGPLRLAPLPADRTAGAAGGPQTAETAPDRQRPRDPARTSTLPPETTEPAPLRLEPTLQSRP
ncbi:MAG: hypothetical protein EBT08_03690 [Betaproteobacteria bacterium]|nr:hypothetical protein [Betaproteobacteria bacterium]